MHGAKFPPSNANLGRLSINNVHKITEFVDLNVQYLVYSSHCSIYLGYFLTSLSLSLWTSYIKAPCPFRRRCRASRVQIPWRKALHSPQFSLSPSFAFRSLCRRCCCSARDSAPLRVVRADAVLTTLRASDTEYRRPSSQTRAGIIFLA